MDHIPSAFTFPIRSDFQITVIFSFSYSGWENFQNVLKKKLRVCSRGLCRKIYLAAAIINNPAMLILDDPAEGLVFDERRELLNAITAVSEDRIVVVASRNISDIEYLSDEVILMEKGCLIRKARISELTEEISSFIYEISVPEEMIPELKKRYCIAQMTYAGTGVKVRLLSENPPWKFDFSPVVPTLNDVYLYHFQMKEKGWNQA